VNRQFNLLAVILSFSAASILMTISTGLAIWSGNGGHPPLTAADAYIYFAEWPMVLLRGTNFEVCSTEAFFVNAVGWNLVGLLFGAWLFRRRSRGFEH
jgi:hypothetical protein